MDEPARTLQDEWGLLMEPLNDVLAEVTVRDYVCSNCWGSLVKFPIQGTRSWLVLCRKCQEETKGYVTRWFAENRRQESLADLPDVKRMLQEAGIIESPPRKSEKKILNELGF